MPHLFPLELTLPVLLASLASWGTFPTTNLKVDRVRKAAGQILGLVYLPFLNPSEVRTL